jgi:hypothetical protein
LDITTEEALEIFQQKPDEYMTLPDFMIMERKNFEESGIHISDYTKDSGQWLNTKSLSRLVHSYWKPDDGRLYLNVFDPGHLGVRPSRCFR